MKRKLLYFLLCLPFTLLNAQEFEIDQGVIDTLSLRFKYEENYQLIKKSLQEDENLIGWTRYYMWKSYKAYVEKKVDSSIYYSNQSLKYFNKERGYWTANSNIHKALYFNGLSLYSQKKIEQSLLTLNKALGFADKYPPVKGETSWRFYIIERISIIHAQKGDYQLALKTKKKLLSDSLYMTRKYDGGNTYNAIGNLFKDYIGDLDSAKIYYDRALRKYANAIEEDYQHTSSIGYYTNVVAAYDNLGDTFYQQQNIDSALFYYRKAWNTYKNKELEKETRDIPTLSFVKVNRGFTLFKGGDIDAAIKITQGVRDSIITDTLYSREERDLRIKTHNFLTEFYQKKGRYNDAITTQKELNDYLIAYNERSISKQLQLFTTQYEVEQKDASIAQLETTTENQQTIIKQRNTISWVLGSLLLSFIGLGVLFYRQRQLQNKYVASNLEQRLLRSQLNPHFLFNALNAVSNLVQKKSEQTIPYISKLGHLLRSILENSREEFISLEEELETIKTYLELQSNFSRKFKYDIHIDEVIDKETLLIPPMFIQPFVENAIDHGFKGEEDEYINIVIGIDKANAILHFEIEDNGMGYSKSLAVKDRTSEHQSLSGTILKERLELYAKAFKTKASYTINDIDRGTKVDLYLPYILE